MKNQAIPPVQALEDIRKLTDAFFKSEARPTREVSALLLKIEMLTTLGRMYAADDLK